MITKVSKIVFLILFSSACLSLAQEANEYIELTTLIKKIEDQFNIKVSYSVKDVDKIKVLQPNEDLDLNETLDYLNANTLLNWQLLDDRYVTVSSLNKLISICGTVFIDSSKEPLLGANVKLFNEQIGVITDENGFFKLEKIPVNGLIEITYLGYKKIVVKASHVVYKSNECKPFYLTENFEELNEILITKFLTTGLQKRLDGSIELRTEKFGILPGLIEPDILQSIQALPGVESTNESIANINVRGGTNDENLIIWDDIKMYHSGHFFGLISAYNPNLTEKVVVSKNGTSAQFGDGVSSTINMSTKNTLTNTFGGGFGANLISADGYLQIPLGKKVELHVSGRRSFTDQFTTFTYDNYFERSFQDSDINTNQSESNRTSSSDFYFYDYTAKLLFDLNEHHQFRFNTIGIDNNLDYTESAVASNNESSSKFSNLSQQNLGFGFNWNGQWTPKLSSELVAYYSKYNVDANDLRVETNQSLSQANEVLDTGLKLNFNYQFNSKMKLLVGYQLNETGILNETTVSAPSYNKTKKDVLLNHATFSEIEFKNQSTYFRAGLRLNYFEKFGKYILEPRFNFRQKLFWDVAAKIEGEFKNQSATQIIDFQNDFLGVENRRWILANETDIPISTSKQGSVGLEFNRKNLNVEVTTFYKYVEGITASNQGFYNNFQFLNAQGTYEAKGIEFLANKTSTNYSVWLSYIYSLNNYDFEAFTPSKFPNNSDIRHSVSFAVNYNLLDNLELSAGAMWRSGIPFTKPIEGNETVQNGNTTFVNYDLPNNENLDPFKRIDASLNYKFKLSSLTSAVITLGVRNITDESNIISRYYEVDPNNSEKTIRIDNTSLGMTPNMSFRISF